DIWAADLRAATDGLLAGRTVGHQELGALAVRVADHLDHLEAGQAGTGWAARTFQTRGAGGTGWANGAGWALNASRTGGTLRAGRACGAGRTRWADRTDRTGWPHGPWVTLRAW